MHTEPPTASELESRVAEIDGFVSPDECERIVSLYRRKKSHSARDDCFVQVAVLTNGESAETTGLITSLEARINAKVGEFFAVPNGVTTSHMGIAQREEGQACALHSDCRELVCPTHGKDQPTLRDAGCNCPDAKYVDKKSADYEFTALVYLNDDFEGALLRVGDGPVNRIFQREIKLRKGLLVLFPGDEYYYHEVSPVTRGVRYFLTSWFSRTADGAAH